MVGHRHLLRAQVLLDRQRVVRAALHRRVVGDDDDLAAGDTPDPGDQARAGGIAVVDPMRGQRREFQEGRAGIEQSVDAIAHEQLALGLMTFEGFGAATGAGECPDVAQPLRQIAVGGGVGPKGLAGGVDVGRQPFHGRATSRSSPS